MRASARALAIEVRGAFANTPFPAGDLISHNPGNDEGTAEYFRGKSWRDIERAALLRRRFALVAFTPAAFAYFLPAFLVASLEAPNLDLLDALTSALRPPKNKPKRPSYWAWWSLLTVPQRRVVIKCLRHWDSADFGDLSSAAASLEENVDA